METFTRSDLGSGVRRRQPAWRPVRQGRPVRRRDARGRPGPGDIDAPWLSAGRLPARQRRRRHPSRRGRARPPLPRPRPPTRRRSGWPPPAWAELERTWAATLERVAAMPAGTVDLSVDGEWSFAQTCGTWCWRPTPGWVGDPGDRAAVPPHRSSRPRCRGRRPGHVDLHDDHPVLRRGARGRAGRVAMVRDFLATVTAEELAMVRTNPGTPTTRRPRCLLT